MFNKNTPDALEILLESIAEKKQVNLHYRSFHLDDAIERVIEPVGLFHENNYWYVKAWCHLRSDYRHFRTDRMTAISRTRESFTMNHDNVKLNGPQEDTAPKTKVVIRVNKEVVRYIQTGRKYYGFVSEKQIEDEVEMTFLTSDINYGLARWYMMFADCAQIVEPENFKQQIEALAEQIKEKLKT